MCSFKGLIPPQWDFMGLYFAAWEVGKKLGSVVKNLPAIAGDMGSIPGSGRFPGGGNGNPLQDSRLEKPMNRGA